MLSITRELEFGDKKITVRELTVAEVRAWLSEPQDIENREFDALTGLMSFDEIGVNDIYRFTDMKPADVEELTPSALKKIAAVVKELNSVFFCEYLQRLKEVQKRIEQNSPQKASN
jgi:hypothetical protein